MNCSLSLTRFRRADRTVDVEKTVLHASPSPRCEESLLLAYFGLAIWRISGRNSEWKFPGGLGNVREDIGGSGIMAITDGASAIGVGNIIVQSPHGDIKLAALTGFRRHAVRSASAPP